MTYIPHRQGHGGVSSDERQIFHGKRSHAQGTCRVASYQGVTYSEDALTAQRLKLLLFVLHGIKMETLSFRLTRLTILPFSCIICPINSLFRHIQALVCELRRILVPLSTWLPPCVGSVGLANRQRTVVSLAEVAQHRPRSGP